ncbi:MAG: hypothetical protein KGI47_01635 [Betaproteobacteria bacterium]|nr:hypothetical protein [Betaproteobacteria bacterium]MDE2622871.1 hypothetical protein [Betaproteobacteria bacterium]
MSDCCSSTGCGTSHRKKRHCPANGREYPEVSVRTISHHILGAWEWPFSATHYYFCDDPQCEVKYFGDDGSVILKSQLRTSAGIKAGANEDLLCYCYGISKEDFHRNPATREFVIAQTKAGLCSCKTSNPSGRCCLKDFPKS